MTIILAGIASAIAGSLGAAVGVTRRLSRSIAELNELIEAGETR